MAESRPARVSPWRVVLRQMRAYGLTERSGDVRYVRTLLQYDRPLTAFRAAELARLFSTSAGFWTHLERVYREG